MEPKMKLVYEKILKFYSVEKNVISFLEIARNDRKYAKRVIEWFVANYSKQYPVSYVIKNKTFDVYSQYKIQLKSFSKDLFDPFRRKDKILFMMGKTEIETTLGQLNFFKWAIQNKVVDWIRANYVAIQNHMKSTIPKEKTAKGKRKRLCKNATTKCVCIKKYQNVVLKFE
jgi:hypothetical protein